MSNALSTRRVNSNGRKVRLGKRERERLRQLKIAMGVRPRGALDAAKDTVCSDGQFTSAWTILERGLRGDQKPTGKPKRGFNGQRQKITANRNVRSDFGPSLIRSPGKTGRWRYAEKLN